MLDGTVQPTSTASASVLLVDAGLGRSSGLTAGVAETAGSPAFLRTPGIDGAFEALSRHTFDCVVVDLALAESRHPDTWDRLRSIAGGTALLALTDGQVEDAHPGLLLADDVVRRHELEGREGVRSVLRSMRHAYLADELRRAQEAAHGAARRLTDLLENTPDAVYTIDARGVITSWNRGSAALYGYAREEVVGTHVSLLHPPGVDELTSIMAVLSRGEAVRALETVRRTKAGRDVHVSMTVCPVPGPEGRLHSATVVAQDISDRRELETELLRAFMHDGLTGLPNRAHLIDRLSHLLASRPQGDPGQDAGRDPGRSPVAVFFLDLDQFKRINEVQGHWAGDRVLAEVGLRLEQRVAGEGDMVARLGGDEFVLVCPDTDTTAALDVAERIFEELSRPVRLEGRSMRISASIGIAVTPPLEADAEGLLRDADAAMYEAKARGRSRSQVFDVSLATRSRDQLVLAEDLREALARDLLDVRYQPIVELGGQRLVGFEALARWEHPTRGQVSPADFVPLAERNGFVSDLDRWVLTRACRDARRGREAGVLPADARVSVNLSAHSLGDAALVTWVHDVLAAEGLPADALVLEITETALMHDIETARRSLEGLRTLGAGIALDDFGTGYSSLSFLRELPVTQVKIDRSFVNNIAQNGEDLLITESIVDLARGLGLETVAEGVETEGQLALLRRLGCASAQGHLWSGAVALDQLGHDADGLAVVAVLPGGRPARRSHHGRRWARGLRRRTTPAAPAGALRHSPDHQIAGAIRAGLDAEETWLVIAVAEHRAALRDALGPAHLAAVSRGDYVELDAADTLARICGGDELDPDRFDRVIGELVRRLHARGGRVRVYAELTGLLLRAEEVPAAVAVEDLWDGLRVSLGLSVWCGYDPDQRFAREHALVCTRHEHVAWRDSASDRFLPDEDAG